MPRLSTPRCCSRASRCCVLLLVAAAGFLFVQRGLWLQVVYPGLALLAPLALLAALRLTASERETRDVAAEKVENQKLLGLSFQEKGMLDMALATFNKLPFADDMKLIYLNLGLDYENRGQRDKAYLVYKKLFDADPRFEDVAPSPGAPQPVGGASSSAFGAAHAADRSRRHGQPDLLHSRPLPAPPQPTPSPRVSPSLVASLRAAPAAEAPTQLGPRAPTEVAASRSEIRDVGSETKPSDTDGSRSRADARDARDRGRLPRHADASPRRSRHARLALRPVPPGRAPPRPRGNGPTSIWCATRSSTARPRSRPSARTRTWTPGS